MRPKPRGTCWSPTAGVAGSHRGTQHGFNNDTTPRYDETAAKTAWRRTIAQFNRTLRA